MSAGRFPYTAGRATVLTALAILREAHREGRLKIPPREIPWLDRLQKVLETLPDTESAFIDDRMGRIDATKFIPAEYGL